jgi:hypothetical protein
MVVAGPCVGVVVGETSNVGVVFIGTSEELPDCDAVGKRLQALNSAIIEQSKTMALIHGRPT